jgi:tRNA-dihydrouridine synthase B
MNVELTQKYLGGRLNFPLSLAPMVGLSHVGLRRLVREYMPRGSHTIWPTEMLNSRKLPIENFAIVPEVARHDSEDFLVPQILGNEEKPIAASVKRLEDWGAYGIDINMGCPVQKALKHNYGVALMGDPEYAREVVRMTTSNTKLPVSVKLRAGVQKDFSYLKDFVIGLQDSGVSWLCLHPRTSDQQRRGQADWEQILQLKKILNIPLIGNGDIQIATDVHRMMEETGCDLVMSGRALAARPWLMWQVGEDLGLPAPVGREGLSAPRTKEEEGAEYGKSVLRLIEIMREHFTEEQTLRKLRFHIRTTAVWLFFGQTVVSISTKGKSLSEVEANLREYFLKPIEMVGKTELRQ